MIAGVYVDGGLCVGVGGPGSAFISLNCNAEGSIRRLNLAYKRIVYLLKFPQKMLQRVIISRVDLHYSASKLKTIQNRSSCKFLWETTNGNIHER